MEAFSGVCYHPYSLLLLAVFHIIRLGGAVSTGEEEADLIKELLKGNKVLLSLVQTQF